MHTIFITGFPGFLGARLIPLLIQDRGVAIHFVLIIQKQFETFAEEMLQKIKQQHPDFEGKFTLVCGDITQPELGLKNYTQHNEIHEIFHLAAIYDLAVSLEKGHLANVVGTTQILEFAKKCKNLQRHHYISTCYVSGKRTGDILEEELEHQTGFRNHYEKTKYDAEVLVKNTLSDIPTTIYRPAIVIGSSKTGETGKFDGPYFLLHLLYKLPKYLVMSRLGNGMHPINLVPWDFVVKSISLLSKMPESLGKTFQLADPNALSQNELTKIFLEKMDKRSITLQLPAFMVKAPFYLKPMQSIFHVIPEIFDYFDHPHRYDTKNTQELLSPQGVTCPNFADYAQNIMDFFLQEISKK